MSLHHLDFAAEFARLVTEGRPDSSTVLGGVKVRFVRVAGGCEGRWDSHADSTETAIVWTGDFAVEFRDGTVALGPGQCCVVPVGAEHRGTSKGGAEVILFTDAAG